MNDVIATQTQILDLIIAPRTLFRNFEVTQHRRTGRQTKAVTFPVAKGYKIERHTPTVQCSGNINRGKREFHCLNIKIGIHIHLPVFG